ncbi:MAG: hypothetical protein NUV56_04600 [Candidatus Uhrbacteria bacterium]|nr:hypothetical protein [Candidatus Uhrbacteria bacterium]
MTSPSISKKLTSLGLTESESKVYLAMLKLGASTVQNIAKTAALSRTATYQIISELEKKALVSTFIEKKKKLFTAEDPEKLESFFAQHIDGMRAELNSFNRLVPELRALQTGDMKPRVRLYRGVEGVRALFRDLAVANPSELLEITNVDAVFNRIDQSVILEEREKFAHSNMKVKVLRRGKPRMLPSRAECRDIPHNTLDFQGNIWIYGSHIAFTHFSNDIETVIIDNALFSETMRALFLVIWQCADECLIKQK